MRPATATATVTFSKPRASAPRRLADACINFSGPPPLGGTRIVGLSIMQAKNGSLYVTVPARPFEMGGYQRHHDYLRSQEGAGPGPSLALKEWVLDEYLKQASL